MQKPCSWLNVVIFVRSKNDGDVRLDFSREVKQATKTLLRCHQVREEVSPAKKKTDYTGLIQLYFWISCFWDVSSSPTLLTNRIRNRCKWFFIGSRFFGSRVGVFTRETIWKLETLFDLQRRWEGKLGCNEFSPFDETLLYFQCRASLIPKLSASLTWRVFEIFLLRVSVTMGFLWCNFIMCSMRRSLILELVNSKLSKIFGILFLDIIG